MRLALNDLRKVESLPETYQVDMGSWHCPYLNSSAGDESACHVCFAGSVMAISLKANPELRLGAGDYGPEWSNVFRALDFARVGEVRNAFAELGRDPMKLIKANLFERDADVSYHSEDPKQFRKDMFKIVHALERIGE